MQRYTWGLALFALIVCGHTAKLRGQGYTYLETFDNDTDTYTPPTTYGSSPSVAPGTPPANWQDGRNAPFASSNHLIEEVASGYNGVVTGPHGGAHMGLVYGGGSWGHMGLPSPHPLGSVSFQMDFLSDLSLSLGFSGHSLLLETRAFRLRADGSFDTFVFTDMGMYQGMDAASGELRHTLFRYNAQGVAEPFFVLAEDPGWYTFEVVYKASDTTDPASGLPFMAEVINIYQQTRFENGFRQGQLLTSLETDLTSVAPPFIAPIGVAAASSAVPRRFQYIDNAAIGPPINTPEPGSIAVILAGLIAAAARRPRAAG